MSTANRREFLGAALSAPALRAAASKRKPNVILILTDDQGYGDLSCHGNPVIRTPELDRLHSESVRFTNFHSDPLCSPTRAALMTGRYSARTGVWATIFSRNIPRADEVTMAEVFAANGYRTGIFGKWHLGDNAPYRPQDRGFHEALIHGGGGVGQAPDYWGNSYFDDTYFRNGKPEKCKGYCTDVWFDNAMRFIEQNRNRPFFVYIPTNAPHSPFNVDPKYAKPYLDSGLTPAMANFYGMIANIDENIGRLRAKLRELNLERDTILVFTTDNGTAGGLAPPKVQAKFRGFSAGMREAKASAYEGGHRVPCFIYWPGGGIQGGRDINRLVCHFDLLPTFMSLCGLVRKQGPPLDGTSLAGLLLNKGDIGDRTLIVQTQQRETPQKWTRSAVMTQQWRLVNGAELYDIQADPGQTKDIASQHPEVVARLRAAYEKWWDQVSPRFSESVELVLGDPRENPTHLSSMDWHADQIPPWNQEQIKKEVVANGYWTVRVARAGMYEIALRERPHEAPAPLRARRARLKIGPVDETKAAPEGAPAVVFNVKLPAGSARMETWLSEHPDGNVRGAYYADVRFKG